MELSEGISRTADSAEDTGLTAIGLLVAIIANMVIVGILYVSVLLLARGFGLLAGIGAK